MNSAMTLQASHPIHLSSAARRCLVAVVVYGVVGIVTAFALANESRSPLETWLQERFPGSRPDAFKGMNSLMNPWVVSLWVCWSALVLFCWILRRYVSVKVSSTRKALRSNEVRNAFFLWPKGGVLSFSTFTPLF